MGIKIKWNTERLLGISAMSISFITLLIFIYQTNLIRKQNFLSILPYLSISTSDNSVNNTFKISLENYGVGPAIIDEVTISYLDKVYDLRDYENDMFTFFASRKKVLENINNLSYSTLETGMAIPANTSYNIVEIKNDSLDYQLFKNNIQDLLDEGIYIEIRYKSIQDEHWIISNISGSPKKID